MREAGPSCYLIFAPETSPQWFNPFNTKCKFPNKSESMNIRKPLNNLLTKLENQNLLNIVDLFEVFCPKEECSFYNEDNILLYRDNVHPSFEAGILSFPKIKSVLDRL